MRKMTRAEWARKHRDQKLVDAAGQRWVLALEAETGATVLEQVEVSDA